MKTTNVKLLTISAAATLAGCQVAMPGSYRAPGTTFAAPTQTQVVGHSMYMTRDSDGNSVPRETVNLYNAFTGQRETQTYVDRQLVADTASISSNGFVPRAQQDFYNQASNFVNNGLRQIRYNQEQRFQPQRIIVFKRR